MANPENPERITNALEIKKAKLIKSLATTKQKIKDIAIEIELAEFRAWKAKNDKRK